MSSFDKDLLGESHVTSVDEISRLPMNAQVVYVSDLDDEKIRALARLKDLRDLNADGCSGLTDSGLAEIKRFENLETLDLEGASSITDNAVDHLVFLHKLKYLDLRGCPQISKDAVWRLTSALAGCEVDVDITE